MVAQGTQKLLTNSDTWVSIIPNTANQLTQIVRITCPRGLAWVIPGEFPLRLKMQATGGAELPISSEFYFGVRVPFEGQLIYPVGSRNLYHAWHDLSMRDQRDEDFSTAVLVDLGVDFLPIAEEEQLIISLFSSVVLAPALLRFQIPYFERSIADIGAELEYRRDALRL